MIPLLAQRTVQRVRYPTPEVVDGAAVRGTPAARAITASVVPASERVISWLPEGMRSSEVIQVYTRDEIRGVDEHDGTQPDRLVIDGRTYLAQRVRVLPAFLGTGGHYEVTAVRVAPLEVTQ